MPIYEYQCQGCQKLQEIIQKINDKPLKKCPECGGKLVKSVSLSGFQLKGGGWFQDGYASKKAEHKPSPVKVGSKGTPLSESKPKAGSTPKT